MARLIALIFAVGAAYRIWRDWRNTVDAGETFAMLPLGDLWQAISPATMASIQEMTSGLLSDDAQASALNVPVAAILLVVAALFWFLGRAPAPKRKQFGR